MSDNQKLSAHSESSGTPSEPADPAAWSGACCGTPDTAAGRNTDTETQKHKERTQAEYKDLIHRLNRIEGQVRGIKGMVERDAYCTDILVQVAAVNAALNSFNKELLANHIKTCVTRDIRDGKEETVDELVRTLQKLMK